VRRDPCGGALVVPSETTIRRALADSDAGALDEQLADAVAAARVSVDGQDDARRGPGRRAGAPAGGDERGRRGAGPARGGLSDFRCEAFSGFLFCPYSEGREPAHPL